MIAVAQPGDVAREAAKLARFRQLAKPTERQAWAMLAEQAQMPHLPFGDGPGAPAFATTLTALKASVTVNTVAVATSIIGADNRGPFALDYFSTVGASWAMEGMGIISSTGTPTIAFRVTFGTAFATITTMLAQTAALTTISGIANVDWYIKVLGVVKQASGSTSTMLVTGYVISQIVTAAANNIVTFMKNATPPTAVVTDLSGFCFLDLQGTWSVSNVANSTITNSYTLESIWAA